MRHKDSQRLADEVLVYNFVTIKRDASFFPITIFWKLPKKAHSPTTFEKLYVPQYKLKELTKED